MSVSTWLPEGLAFVGWFIFAIDNWRLRRRLRYEQTVREAEEALGPPRIGDIVMPDPSDPRWAPDDRSFTDHNGFRIERRVLALDTISVLETGTVFIGHGQPIEGGAAYGKRVLHAYRRRLADKARGVCSP